MIFLISPFMILVLSRYSPATLSHTHSSIPLLAHREHLGRVIDFVITVGGDGTILHTSSLFPKDVPPILSFSKGGTLCFLVPHSTSPSSPLSPHSHTHISSPIALAEHQKALRETYEGGFSVTRRMRLQSTVHHTDPLSGLPMQTQLGTRPLLSLFSTTDSHPSDLTLQHNF